MSIPTLPSPEIELIDRLGSGANKAGEVDICRIPNPCRGNAPANNATSSDPDSDDKPMTAGINGKTAT